MFLLNCFLQWNASETRLLTLPECCMNPWQVLAQEMTPLCGQYSHDLRLIWCKSKIVLKRPISNLSEKWLLYVCPMFHLSFSKFSISLALNFCIFFSFSAEWYLRRLQENHACSCWRRTVRQKMKHLFLSSILKFPIWLHVLSVICVLCYVALF